MRPARIALLHYTASPVVGGVEEILDQQASLFLRHGQRVKVIAGRGERTGKDYEVEINPLLDSRHPDILRTQKRIPHQGTEFRSLADALYLYLQQALEGFDVLIAHNVLTMAYNLPLTYALHKLADGKTIKIVAWNHDSPFFYPGHADDLNRAPWRILKRSHPAIRNIAISESRKRQFLLLFGRKTRIDVIPNGIDPFQFYHLGSETVRFIQESRLFDSDLLIVQPSRLHPRKNIELSIRVLRALHDRDVKATLIVTGAYDPHQNKEVRYYSKLRALAQELMIEEYVWIISEDNLPSGKKLTIDRITIRDLYLIADILFLPSLQEGFGLPLLEAGLMKLPIFCSEIPPFREIGGNDISTFGLDDPPEKIADQILALSSRPGPSSLYRRVIRYHVWDNIYRSLLFPFINSLISGS